MSVLFVLAALFAAVLTLLVVRDHRNSGIHDGWYGHSDASTDRTTSWRGRD